MRDKFLPIYKITRGKSKKYQKLTIMPSSVTQFSPKARWEGATLQIKFLPLELSINGSYT
jgi:hypothetical protein